MEEFNIEDYKDYENVTIAQYKVALDNVEKDALEAAGKGDLKTAWHNAKIYFELNKLLSKRVSYNSKYGSNKKGHTK